MERTPHAPNTLIQTLNRPSIQSPVLLSRAAPQQLRLLPYTLILQVLNTYASLRAVDVVRDDNRVVGRAGRDGDFYRRVALCEGRKGGFEEGVHAPGGTPPIAVVEGYGLAGQDEGSYAVLWAR
jgi:hypothetical protein